MSKKIILKTGKDLPLKRRHPWVFSGAIDTMDKGVRDGDRVDVKNAAGDYLATGHYQSGNSIAIRIISFVAITDIQSFWEGKIQNAYNYRKAIGLIDNSATECYRLIHAEGDGLPGLIIDIYKHTAVIQCHSIGMYKAIDNISKAIQSIYGNRITSIYSKSHATLPKPFSNDIIDGYIIGDQSTCPTIVKENNVNFEINWETGQKTGFFLDQRDNREHMTTYVKGKKVLNAFSYSGGFSVYALLKGAAEVHSVDVSAIATELASRNVNLNEIGHSAKHRSITQDVLFFLKNTEESYDVMIIDPPAFAKSIKKRHNAVKAYKKLNLLAMQRINPGGIIATFSCSQVVDKQLFYDTIKAAAIEADKSVRVLRHLSQPADHPVSLFHDQSSYLKGLVLYVD